jgi:hypothetical protein
MRANLGYMDTSGKCVPNGGVNGDEPVTNNTQGISNLLQFSDNGNGVIHLDNIAGNPAGLGSAAYGFNSSSGNTMFYTSGYSPGTCSGEIVTVTKQDAGPDSAGSVSAYRYVLNSTNDIEKTINDTTKDSVFLSYITDPISGAAGCGVSKSKINFGRNVDNSYSPFGIIGAVPDISKLTPGAGPVTPGNAGTSTDACDASHTGMEWLVCPVLSMVDAGNRAIMSTFTGQLPFTVDQLMNKDHNQKNQNLHNAWAGIRDLASAFLVVVMLVMIFSQAISFGPFDAYTVRKVLPKIVIAVIIMQLSWVLISTVVNMVNTLGQGLGGLLYAPFGGKQYLDSPDTLWYLLGNAHIGSMANIITSWPAAIVFLGIGLANLGAVLMGAIAGGVALLVGLAALIFRKIVIMLCLLFAPIALLIWILPGSGMQRYFKIWSENLTKSLMMYPLIILMIAGGRIFAWVGGNQGTSTTDHFVSFFIVLVGYFGPLFILPKTYKWGGQAMSLAGSSLSSLGAKVNKTLDKPTRDMSKRLQNRLVDSMYRTTVPGEGKGTPSRYARTKAGLLRGAVRTAGGHPIPTKRQTNTMLKEAGEWKGEELGLIEGKMASDFKEFQKLEKLGVSPAKELMRDKYWTNGNAMQRRAFGQWALATNSFMELSQYQWRQGGHQLDNGKGGKVWVPKSVTDWKDGEGKDKHGNKVTTDDLKAHPERYWDPRDDMARTQDWVDLEHNNPDFIKAISEKAPRLMNFRTALGGGPDPMDYLPAGSEANSEDGKFVSENPPIPDSDFMPGGQYADANPTKDPTIAHAMAQEYRVKKGYWLADQAGFGKPFSQTEDPSAPTRWRPEHYEELADVGQMLLATGAKPEQLKGAIALKTHIDEQSDSHFGRSNLQGLTGADSAPIDVIMQSVGAPSRHLETSLEKKTPDRPAGSSQGTVTISHSAARHMSDTDAGAWIEKRGGIENVSTGDLARLSTNLGRYPTGTGITVKNAQGRDVPVGGTLRPDARSDTWTAVQAELANRPTRPGLAGPVGPLPGGTTPPPVIPPPDPGDARGPDHGPEAGLTGLTYSREKAIDMAVPLPSPAASVEMVSEPIEKAMPGTAGEMTVDHPTEEMPEPLAYESTPLPPISSSTPSAPPTVKVVLPTGFNTGSSTPVGTRRSGSSSTSDMPQTIIPGRLRERTAEEVIRDQQNVERQQEIDYQLRKQREKERQKTANWTPRSGVNTGGFKIEHNTQPPPSGNQPGSVIRPNTPPDTPPES